LYDNQNLKGNVDEHGELVKDGVLNKINKYKKNKFIETEQG
jgi:hypothetical protein